MSLCGCGVQREVGFGVCSCEEFVGGLMCVWRAGGVVCWVLGFCEIERSRR